MVKKESSRNNATREVAVTSNVVVVVVAAPIFSNTNSVVRVDLDQSYYVVIVAVLEYNSTPLVESVVLT